MSDTRKVQTQEEKIAYWKKRMIAATRTAIGWSAGDLERICDYAAHMQLEDEKITNAVEKINTAFTELIAAIVTAKPKVEKKKKKEKKNEI